MFTASRTLAASTLLVATMDHGWVGTHGIGCTGN